MNSHFFSLTVFRSHSVGSPVWKAKIELALLSKLIAAASCLADRKV